MDADFRRMRGLRIATLAAATFAVASGCQVAAKIPGVAEVTNTISRAQAPAEPLAPEMPLTVAPLPVPEPTLTPVAYTAPVAPAVGAGEALRYKQVQVAASIGNESVITDDEVWSMVRQRAREYVQLPAIEGKKKEQEIYKEELRRIIDRELIVVELYSRMKKNKAEARIDDLKQHARDEATRKFADIRKMNKFESEEQLLAALKAQGVTYKALRRQWEQETLMQVFLQQQLKDKVKFITLNDVWEYYVGHPKEFQIEDRAKWLDLFVSYRKFATPEAAKAHAEEAWKQAMAGADFVKLVEKYGQGDSNLRAGEGIGQKRGEVQPAELEQVLFDMDANQVSPLLQTATGYHIVKIVERDKAGVLPFDEKIQAAVRERLTRQLQAKEVDKIVEDLWRKHRPKVVETP